MFVFGTVSGCYVHQLKIFFTQNETKTVPSVNNNQLQSGDGADDVLMLLQAHERKAKKGGGRNSDSDSDDSGDENVKKAAKATPDTAFGPESRGKCCSYFLSLFIFIYRIPGIFLCHFSH